MSPSIVIALLVVVVAIALLARRLDLPYPIALVVGGAGIAVLPDVPAVALDPELIFVIVLPPVLMEAAYLTSWRDFRANLRAIVLLAVGLVAATAAAVAAVVVWLVPGMSWAAGFVLGAIVSPPDAVAATAIARRLAVPRRAITVLEGESLVNDATGLVLYKFAVAAVVTGGFALGAALLEFLWIAAAGIAVGIAVGHAFVRLFPILRDPLVETISTFLCAYGAYLGAEATGGSGVLAVVAGGLVVGWNAPELFSPSFRLRALSVWETVIFAINGLVFLLIGLQLPAVVSGLAAYDTADVALYAVAVSVVTIVVRLVWVFPAAYIPRALSRRIRARDPYPPWRQLVLIGWTGMRGVVSLAAALALPLVVADQSRFPHRDLIVFLSFVVIVATLVLQGLTLSGLIRVLRITGGDETETERREAERRTIESGLARLAELAVDPGIPALAVGRVREHYESRSRAMDGDPVADHPSVEAAVAFVYREAIAAERRALIALRRRRLIGDEAMRLVERDLDLVEARSAPIEEGAFSGLPASRGPGP